VASAPQVIDRMVSSNSWLVDIFGDFRVNSIWANVGKRGTLGSVMANLVVTVPVFMATGQKNDANLEETTRTDLHCEPIANLVYQTEGEKTWTLIDPAYSRLLKPTLAPDGRAYFYSQLDPLQSNSLEHAPRWEIKTIAGDVMYVPTWTWHRVEYLEGITAVSVSLFEFRGGEFMMNNFVFAMTLIPNLIKELLGLKLQ
jgi:hypothetical protein